MEDQEDIIGYIAETLALGMPVPKHYEMARSLMNRFDIKVKPQDMSLFRPGDVVIDDKGSMWVRRYKNKQIPPVGGPDWSLVWIGDGDQEVNQEVDSEENWATGDDFLAWRRLTLLVRNGEAMPHKLQQVVSEKL